MCTGCRCVYVGVCMWVCGCVCVWVRERVGGDPVCSAYHISLCPLAIGCLTGPRVHYFR